MIRIQKLYFIALIIAYGCSSSSNREQSAANDSIPELAAELDTLSNFMDLYEIKVEGDSVRLLFGVGEGGDEAIIRTRIKGMLTEAEVGRGMAGIDLLGPMPTGYSPTEMDFSYSGTANENILGAQFYVKYVNRGSGNEVVLLENKSDPSRLLGKWKKLEGAPGNFYFPTYSDAETPTLHFYVDPDVNEKFPRLAVNLGQMADEYRITDFSFHNYGTKAWISISSVYGENSKYFYLTEVLDDDGEYLYSTVEGLFETPRNFVFELYFSKYREQAQD